MENNFKEQDPKDDDWGNPPAPDTPENRKKIFRARVILGVAALIFTLLPAIAIWYAKR